MAKNFDEELNYYKKYLQDYAAEKLQKSKNNLYNCPFCGSGTGKHGTGALKVFPDGIFKCFACNKTGNIYQLAQQVENLDFRQAKNFIYNKYFNYTSTAENKATGVVIADKKEKEFTDCTMFCKNAHRNIDQTDYFLKRGLTAATTRYFRCGFHRNFKTVESITDRAIIPTFYLDNRQVKTSYLARATQKAEDPKTFRGKKEIFNFYRAIKYPVIFLLEGEFDAMSFFELTGYGGVCALSGTAQYKLFCEKLIKYMAYTRAEKTVYLLLDNDTAGETTVTAILEYILNKELLEKLKIDRAAEEFVIRNILMPAPDTGDLYAGYKDLNELLVADREKAYRNVLQMFETERLNDIIDIVREKEKK